MSSVLVREDSGFATPELYELCEECQNFYAVRLKSNGNSGKIAEQFVSINDQHDCDKKEVYYVFYNLSSEKLVTSTKDLY